MSWVRREDWSEAWWSRRWELEGAEEGGASEEVVEEGSGRRKEAELEGRREESVGWEPRWRREEGGTGRRVSGRGVKAGGVDVGRREERGSSSSGEGGVGRAGGAGRVGGEGTGRGESAGVV